MSEMESKSPAPKNTDFMHTLSNLNMETKTFRKQET